MKNFEKLAPISLNEMKHIKGGDSTTTTVDPITPDATLAEGKKGLNAVNVKTC